VKNQLLSGGENMLAKIPRLVIAAPKGRSGKTTVTMGLLAALKRLGLTVQPFKKGPDYIDPSWMTAIAGRNCYNLDSVLMTAETIRESFVANSLDAEISIVEGAMGLYDGLDLAGSGSTAQIAKIIAAPVILVVDCTRMTRSVAATVMGYQQFDKEINIAGIILNKVGGTRHERILRGAIDTYCHVPVLGSIAKNNEIAIPDRHLGLIPAGEAAELRLRIEAIGTVIGEQVDIPKLLELARGPRQLAYYPFKKSAEARKSDVTIGVIKDQVFSFYYKENLDLLAAAGARLVYLDSLTSTELGDIHGLYIGGGFPEVFAAQLEANKDFRQSILKAVNGGLPVYAECGGLMYLGRKIIYAGKEASMVGALPFDVILEAKPQGHGYTIMQVTEPNGFFPVGETIKGHEFHHSRLINIDNHKLNFALKVERGKGVDGKHDGIIYKNVYAAYNHLHGLATPQWAANFVELARRYWAVGSSAIS
jgi:cobyrinic acid a,c-diamide synthase